MITTPLMRTDIEGDPVNLALATAGDGTAVQLRPLRGDERELVARFFAGLSAESRRRRFLQSMPRLSEAMLRRLLDVDGRRHVAVVATVEGECVGMAHYMALADEPGTEALLGNYPEGQWISRERERLTNAIARVAGNEP